MDIIDLEFEHESRKRQILAKIQKRKDEWETMWARCVGNPEAEALAIQAKLHIQLMETEAFDVFNELAEKIESIRRTVSELKEKEIGEQELGADS